jgi:hypothetical protein
MNVLEYIYHLLSFPWNFSDPLHLSTLLLQLLMDIDILENYN